MSRHRAKTPRTGRLRRWLGLSPRPPRLHLLPPLHLDLTSAEPASAPFNGRTRPASIGGAADAAPQVSEQPKTAPVQSQESAVEAKEPWIPPNVLEAVSVQTRAYAEPFCDCRQEQAQ